MKVPFYGHIKQGHIKQYHAIREEIDRNSQLVLEWTRPLVDIVDSAVEGAVLRLRPITMTSCGDTGIAAGSAVARNWLRFQRPFAIVIVGGFGSLAAIQKS